MSKQVKITDFTKAALFMLALVLVMAFLCLQLHAQSTSAVTGTGPQVTAQGIVFPLQDPPEQISSASVTRIGNPGMRTMYYWIVSHTLFGASAPAGPFTVTQAANFFTSGAGAKTTWSPASNVTSYDLLRTATPAAPAGACNCAVATGLVLATFSDVAESLGVYTVASANAGIAILHLQNIAQGTGTNCLAIERTCIGGFVPPTVYYQTVQAAGTPLPQQPFINFLAPLTAANDGAGTRTNVGLAASGITPGTYCSATYDTYGRATAGTACPAPPTTVDEWFSFAGCTATATILTPYNVNATCSAPATLPTPMADTSYTLACAPVGFSGSLSPAPRDTASYSAVYSMDSKTTTGFTANITAMFATNTDAVTAAAGYASFDCYAHHN